MDTNQGLTVGALSGTSGPMTGITALPAAGHSFPITTYIPPSNIQQQGGNKSASVQSSYSVQAMPGGAFTTIFAPGTSVQLGQTLAQGQQQGSVQVKRPLHFFIFTSNDKHSYLVSLDRVKLFLFSQVVVLESY